ncbi:MAG TPA: hypothetical protein VH440_10395 [Candidatus Limnocylindrales bacterium]|jgi:hypothetical protein
MTVEQGLLLLIAAAAVGVVAMIFVLRRQRREREAIQESRFATSTEGEKRCPYCGMFNLWTARDCVSCHRKLPG